MGLILHSFSKAVRIFTCAAIGATSAFAVTTFVGYGFTGTGSGGQQIGVDPRKRAFQNAIDTSFNNLAILLGSDFDNPNNIADNWFGSATPETLEGCVSNGDSGGGVFLTVNSQTYLAGIISFVVGQDGNNNADYGDASGFGQVSAFNNWILSTIPEPSSMSLLVLAASAFFWKRRQLNRLS